MTNFVIGQRVVYVNDAKWIIYNPRIEMPVKGEIYTVREILEGCCPALQRVAPLIRVREIRNPPTTGCHFCGRPQEQKFPAHRFRPLVDVKDRTSLPESITRLLDAGAPIREDEVA